MSPFVRLVQKEFKIALREKLIISIGLSTMLLLGIALYTGYISYIHQRKVIDQTKEEKRNEWLNQSDKHPHIAAHYGTFVFKPKTILSVFDFGLDAFTGTSVYLEAHFQHEFMFRPAQDHSSMIRFGELSSALVFQVLIPLLIIFLTFSSYTKERENGTLKLLMSQAINIHLLSWSKIVAYLIMLGLILCPFFVGCIILSGVKFQQNTLPDITSRILLLIFFYGIYLVFFTVFSVWVSFRSTNGRNALLTLLSIWIFFTILMPKTVTNLSESLYSLPSMREFKAQIQKDISHGLDGKTTRLVRKQNLERELLKTYEVDSVQQLPFNFEGVSMQAGEDYGNKVYDYHMEKLRKIFNKQNQLSSIASILNPYMAIQHLSMALSGTDIHTFNHFEDEVENYRRELVRLMNNDMAQNSSYGEFYGYKAGKNLWEEIDDFNYQAPNIIELLKSYLLEISSLLLWIVIVIILLSSAHRKINVVNA